MEGAVAVSLPFRNLIPGLEQEPVSPQGGAG